VVVNGEVVGSWRRNQRAKKVQLAIDPLHEIPSTAASGITAAVTRYGAFLKQPVELSP